jgi:tRNA(fMet)-specific endonuclease VapC
MSTSYLLDSSVLIFSLHHDTKILQKLSEAASLHVSSIAPGELYYGYIKHEQRMKGQMLPDNDLWIAATAIHYGLTLAARDHHFTWIADLSLEQW